MTNATDSNWLDALGAFTPYIVIAFMAVVVAIIVYQLRHPLLWLIQRGIQVLDLFWNVQMWTYPGILLVIGYLIPSLRVEANFSIPVEARLGVLILVIIGIALFIVQLLTANSTRTSLRGLTADFIVAALWVSVLGPVAGALWQRGALEYWFALATLFAMLDLFIGTVVAIRNAFQRTEVAPAFVRG